MEELETQFHLRLPKETHGKVKQRAKMNGRSLNAEITLIIEEALAQPPKITGFRDDAERLAHEHAERFKKVVVETLTTIYRKDE
ncbi:Arc family DNA-binding protein [Serratia marcescens]|uniref:Arc family DNA-binding protein n=1 Tax=Serratia marcescens TaxID=615 RepID=UPI000665A235|nr:Arc family DNA-binding protein [Serratia marcescens]